MMHLAIHDALNAINRRFQPYVLDIATGRQGRLLRRQWPPPRTTCLCQSLARLQLRPAIQDCMMQLAGIEADYTAALADIPGRSPKTQGIVIGHAAAAVILALRVADGSDTLLLDFDYPQGTEPGEYRFTPDVRLCLCTGMGDVTPLRAPRQRQFRQSRPMR